MNKKLSIIFEQKAQFLIKTALKTCGLIFLFFFFASCATQTAQTIQEDLGAEQIFSWMMDENAGDSVYIAFPMERHEKMLEAALSEASISETDYKIITRRTKAFYVAFSPSSESVSLIAYGSYPKNIFSNFISKQDDFKEKTFNTDEVSEDYRTYYTSEDFDVALPNSSLLMVSQKNIENMLTQTSINSSKPIFSEKARAVLSDESAIRFYSPTIAELASQLTGDTIYLPIREFFGTMQNSKKDSSEYTFNIYVEITDQRLLNSTAMILDSLFASAFENYVVEVEDSYIVIKIESVNFNDYLDVIPD